MFAHNTQTHIHLFICGLLIFFPVKSFLIQRIHISMILVAISMSLFVKIILWKRIWFAACNRKSNASIHECESEVSKDIENTTQCKTGNYTVFEWYNKWICCTHVDDDDHDDDDIEYHIWSKPLNEQIIIFYHDVLILSFVLSST